MSDPLDENKNIRGPPIVEGATPYAYLLEQPAKCGVRFRYECEGRIASAVPGAHSTVSYTSYPTLAVTNYHGPVKVIVSCVTASPPYRPHPHNLVGRKHCHDGICEIIFPDSSFCQFTDLGIVCAKRKDIRERLRVREYMQVNPFKTNTQSREQSVKEFDLTTIRLAFEAYIFDPKTEKLSLPLAPVVSNEIYDKKAMSDLNIYRISHTSSPAIGGSTAIILCDRINKEDIQIRFYLCDSAGNLLWERYAAFQGEDVHKHFAICFTVPEFSLAEKNALDAIGYKPNPIVVNVQLVRPSDGALSEPVEFHYYHDSSTLSELTMKSEPISPPNPIRPLSASSNECYLSSNYYYPVLNDAPDTWMMHTLS